MFGENYKGGEKMSILTDNIGLTKPDLRENVLLSVLNGNSDIIDTEIKRLQDKTVEASDTTEGIISLDGIRGIVSELSGGQYVQTFGSSLTSIETGKTYRYVDSNGKGTIYVAINDATNPSGFLAPDTTNFRSLAVDKLFKSSQRGDAQTGLAFNIAQGVINQPQVLNLSKKCSAVILRVAYEKNTQALSATFVLLGSAVSTYRINDFFCSAVRNSDDQVTIYMDNSQATFGTGVAVYSITDLQMID